MVYSTYLKQRILHFYLKEYRAPTIYQIQYFKEGIKCSRRIVSNFLQHFETTGLLTRKPGSGRPSKITRQVKEFVEQKMREDNETTVHQLHKMLRDAGYEISLSTILRCLTSLGWTFRGSAYCQTIREPNKQDFARKYLNDGFNNVLWSDESTIQMESHRRFCCRKKRRSS